MKKQIKTITFEPIKIPSLGAESSDAQIRNSMKRASDLVEEQRVKQLVKANNERSASTYNLSIGHM